jgi:ABC-type long-subunit fatty acid transport system fused permease/ATPase subunit
MAGERSVTVQTGLGGALKMTVPAAVEIFRKVKNIYRLFIIYSYFDTILTMYRKLDEENPLYDMNVGIFLQLIDFS